MRIEIVHNQVNGTPRPPTHQLVQKETRAGIRSSVGEALSYRFATGGAKGAEPIENAVALVAVWPLVSALSPRPATPRNRLQRSHFIKADNDASARRVPVNAYDGVFFTSKSGSLLSHHVCPVRNRRP